MRSSHLISIVNHKGDVGKTTTSVNLGQALALEGFRVLVVDMDPQCNASDILLARNAVTRSLFDPLNPEEVQVQVQSAYTRPKLKGFSACPTFRTRPCWRRT